MEWWQKPVIYGKVLDMGKITGVEKIQDIPPKVLWMYEAVEQLIAEDADINDIRVSTITDKAGIGKGTAYDYFDTKEEILACAVIYYIQKETAEINRVLERKSSFAEQVAFLLEEVEKSGIKQQCIVQYVHIMTDNSALSRLIQEKIHMESVGKYLPVGIFTSILEKAMERGEVRKDLPLEYQVYTLFSRLLSYMICIYKDGPLKLGADRLRPLVYQSILNELCEKNV